MSWVAVSELQKSKGKTKSVSSASKGVLALVAGAGMVLGASNAFAAISITSPGYATAAVSQYDGIGIGISAVSTGRSTIAIGTNANATHRTNLTDPEDTSYITNSIGEESLYGRGTNMALVPSISIGMGSTATSANAIALGTDTHATGNRATAFGAGAQANGNRSTAVGWLNIANGTRSFAMGSGSTANADFSGAMGDKSVANGTSSLALGASAVTTTAAVSALAIGNNANASNAYATALGANSVANLEKSVALGANSTVSAAVATNTATVGGITYNGFAGNNPAAGDVVSVGSSDRKRQIQNVAAGQISSTSTDAINGSQLYMAMKATDNLANSTKNILGGNAVVNPNGSVTYTNIGGTNKNTIEEALKAVKTEVVAGSNVNVTNSAGANGQPIYTVNAYNTTASSVSPAYITVTGKAATAANTTNYEIGLTDKAIKDFTKDADTITNVIAAPNSYVTVTEMAQPTEGASHTYQVGLTQDAITQFTKDTQATVVSTDGTVKVTSANRNANGTLIYDLSVTPAAQGKQIEYFSVNSVVEGNKNNDGATGTNAIAIGPNAAAADQAAIALGTNSNANGNGAAALGVGAIAKGIQATALGHTANASANGATAIGRQTTAGEGDATAIGSNANASAEKASAIGVGTRATANAATAMGANSTASAQSALAIGTRATASGANATAVGPESVASAENALALGHHASTNLAGSVALGNYSTTRAATPTNDATVGKISYSGFAGVNQNTNDVVSVGSVGNERQIQNVAAGQISATSTDAINGSQLYMAMNATNNLANSTASNFGGGSVVNTDGSVTQPQYNVTNADKTQYGNTANNVGDAITNLNSYVNQGFHVKDNAGTNKGTVTPNEAVQFVNGKGTVSNVTEEAGGVTKVTFDVDIGSITVDNTTGAVTTPADENKVATTKTVADAIKNSGFTATSSKSEGEVSGTSAELVNPGDTVTFDAGKNIKVTQTGGKFSFATKDDVTFNSVTSNTITVPTGANGNDKPITITKDGIDAAGKPITNVSSNLPVTNSTGDATNTASQAKPADVNNIKNNAATVDDVLNAGWNLQENGGAKDFVKAYDTVNFVDGKGTKANVTMKSDNTIADVTFNVDTTTISVDETTGKVTPPANDDNKIATAKTVADAISKSGFTAKANSDVGELINPGDVVDLKNGKNITVTRDGANFTFATKDDVTFNSVTFGDNGPKITNNGGNINVAGNDGNPTKITGVKAGENDTDAVNMSQLKQLAAASKESVVSADKSVTVTPTKKDDGSTEFDVAVNVDNETITKDPTTGAVKANTTALNDTNKDGKVDAPNADDAKKLVNAGDITNAINNSGWKAKSGGNKSEGDEAASELINPGDEVEFNAGTNLKVKRVGTVFTFETAQDVKFNTIQLGDNGPKITNEGNNIKIGDKDGNATKITNVANGTAPTDAVNVSQLEAAKAAATTKVEGTQGVTVTPTDNPDGSKTYTVAAKTDGITVKVDDNGNITAVTSGLTNNTNGTVAAPTAPNALVTAKTVADAINNAGFIAKASASAGEVSGNKDQLIKTGETVTLDAGKNIKITQENGKFTFATKDDVNFNSVTSNTIKVPTDENNPDNNPITINKDGINAGDKTISNVAGNLADASTANKQPDANSAANLADKKNNAATVGDVLNAGWNLQGNGQAVDTVVHNDTVDFVNGKGTVVTVKNENGKNIIKVDSPLEFVNTDPNDKSTPSNTAKLTGDVPVQLTNVASGVRKEDGTSLTGKDLADAIKNAEGDTLSNAVNVGDLQAAVNAATTKVEGDKGVTVTPKTNDDGSTTYTVAAKTDNKTVTVDKDGNITAVTSDLANNNNGTVAAPTAPDALVTAKTVADAINNAGFIAKASASAGEVSGNKDQLIKTGETVTLDAGKNIKITQEDGKFTFATKDDVNFNSVTSNTITVPTDTANPANNPITINKDGINAGNKTISNVAGNLADASVAKEQPAANSPESLANKKNNAATVGDVLNAGWNLQGNGQAVDTVVHNDTVNFVNGKGTVVTVENKDGKNIIKVDSPIEFVNKDSNDTSTPSNTAKLTGDAPVQLTNVASGVRKGDGTAPTGKELADAIKNAEGDTLSNAVNVGDLQAAAKASATEVTASGLATLSTRTGENGQAIYNVDVAKADAPTVTRGNVSVKAGDENKVMTAGDIAAAITGSEKTSSVKAGSKAVTVNAAAEDANGNTEYTVDVVTDKTIARDGEGKLTVNVDNTTITTDPNTGEVKANTTTYAPTTDGKVGDAEAPDALVSAKTVADAINASGFNLKTSANGGSKISGSDEMINPGETIDMTAGKNLTVKQEANGKVTYATKDDVTFNTVNSTTVVVGDATDPAKSTTLTSGNKGLDVGGDKITNVANGDISPTSTEVVNGSQLNNYTKVNGNNIGTDNGAINIVNGAGTTVTSDKAGEVKVNVNNTDLTVADNGTINVQDPNGTGAHYVNATTVAKAVNNVSWNVGSGEVEGTNGKSTYTANADSKVKAGETMKVRAGRNIEISGKGKEVDIAVSDNPEFTSVKTGDTVMNNNGVTINNGAAGKSVSLTKNGLDNGGNRITNVKAGEADTDAVNVGQLKGTVNHLNNKINRNNREARAGIAGSNAAAALPQVYIPGKSMVAAAGGTFKGENALAVGYSRSSDNGKLILKLQGNANSRGDIGGGVGVGYQW